MKKLISIISILLLSISIVTNFVFATSDTTMDVPAVLEDVEKRQPDEIQDDVMPISIDLEDEVALEEYIEDDVYMASDFVKLEDSINGNVYIYADKAEISSNSIFGNLFVLAKEVKIDADVFGSIYIAAEDVTITGSADDVYIMANRVNFEENSYISRNARVFSDIVNVKGNIGRDMYSMSNYTSIEDNIVSGIAGRLYYNGNIDLPEYKVSEAIKIEDTNNFKLETEEGLRTLETIGTVLGKIITIAITSTGIFIIIFIIIFSKKYEKTDIKENYVIDIIKGFGGVILIPIISILLITTIIGIPLGLLLLIIYILILMISIPVASIKIAKIILKDNSSSKFLQFITAITIYIVVEVVLKLVPVIGGFIRFIVILYGFKLITSLPFKNKSNKKIEEDEQVIVTPLD